MLDHAIRGLLTMDFGPLSFEPCEDLDFSPPFETVGLYLHIPFCRSLCPYCPYQRVAFEPEKARAFLPRLLREMDLLSRRFPDLKLNSVYFGGGTPTVLDGGLARLVGGLHRRFQLDGPLCIESNPVDLNEGKVRLLKELGFSSVSLGVQSFDADCLRRLGRAGSPERNRDILEALCAADFPSLNVDLMFALPGQSLPSFVRDVRRVADSGASQITAYPLFTFPYSQVGRQRRLLGVGMPPLSLRWRMYRAFCEELEGRGFVRASVWSYMRHEQSYRYSSMTRRRFLGLGPSAASFDGAAYSLNTFCLDGYGQRLDAGRHPTALRLEVGPRLRRLYDLYWQLYEGRLPGGWPLSRSQAFWVHLMQNQFFLRYLDRIWGQARKAAWPERIEF